MNLCRYYLIQTVGVVGAACSEAISFRATWMHGSTALP